MNHSFQPVWVYNIPPRLTGNVMGSSGRLNNRECQPLDRAFCTRDGLGLHTPNQDYDNYFFTIIASDQ